MIYNIKRAFTSKAAHINLSNTFKLCCKVVYPNQFKLIWKCDDDYFVPYIYSVRQKCTIRIKVELTYSISIQFMGRSPNSSLVLNVNLNPTEVKGSLIYKINFYILTIFKANKQGIVKQMATGLDTTIKNESKTLKKMHLELMLIILKGQH